MENPRAELWGKHSFSGIFEEFTIEVPQPQVYLEPGYRNRPRRAGVYDFPLAGIRERTANQVFRRLETTNKLPCGLRKLLVIKEYVHVESLLQDVESEKWSGETSEPEDDSIKDFEMAGQSGSGI